MAVLSKPYRKYPQEPPSSRILWLLAVALGVAIVVSLIRHSL